MTAASNNALRISEENIELLNKSGAVCWSLLIKSLLLIAEYTTNEGPYVEDYFLVFVAVEDHKLLFLTCPGSSKGIEECLSLLQQRMNSPIQLELQGSTEWGSRVVWPPEISGGDYYTFKPASTETLREKVMTKLMGMTYEYEISSTVREYLQNRINAS
jgi:hypothetical protein